jgi:hypothetical protein
MKRKYTKPDFVLERFELAQSIAANCSAENPANPNASIGDPSWGSKDTCGWRVGDYVIWTAANCNDGRGMSIIASPYEEVMGFCYNNPNGDSVIFMS